MKRYVIRYTKEAFSDLMEIRNYLAGALSMPIAEKIRKRIMADIRTLATMPERTPIYDVEPLRSTGLRQHLAAKHYHVFLRVDNDGGNVFISHIYFASADYNATLAAALETSD